VLASDPPRGAARHPVTKQPHLDLREALVPPESFRLRDLAITHRLQQHRKRLGTDEIGSDELMGRTDVQILGHEMKQSPRIDHVASHSARYN